MVEVIRAIILFADIRGSTEFGYTQGIEMHNEMLRDFHKTCHKAVRRFRRDNRLGPGRVEATCRGDECCVFLRGGEPSEDARLAMDLAIYLKEFWKRSRFCRLNWRAADTGLIPQVDLRIGIGCGEVALDHDVWSGRETLEGIRISEAKRIEGQADAASETLIMVKLDIMEACIQAGKKVEFGPRIPLQGKGVPAIHETAVYPVNTYAEWKVIQKKLVPSPKTYFQRLGRAVALHLSGDLERAIRQYGRLLKQRPDDPNVLTNRGAALGHLKRYEEALADFNRSLEIRPDDPDTLSNRGLVLAKLGTPNEALADFNRSLEIRPDDPDTLNNRGATLAALKREEEAFADFKRSLQLRPDHPGYLALRGGSLFLLERYREALADFNRSLELRPDDPGILSMRGGTLGQLNRYVEALADFNRSLELRPDDPIALHNRGLTLTKLGRPKEALADLHRALELQPDEPCIVSSRALALAKLGQEERAFADFARALAPKPSDPDILYDRACALSVAGRWDESLHDLAEAIAGRSGHRGEARQDPDLEPVRSHPQWGPKFWELVGTEDQA
jgi:tetratricopeptide (TPR) repeat protein/class 3 adenylate cyclase